MKGKVALSAYVSFRGKTKSNSTTAGRETFADVAVGAASVKAAVINGEARMMRSECWSAF